TWQDHSLGRASRAIPPELASERDLLRTYGRRHRLINKREADPRPFSPATERQEGRTMDWPVIGGHLAHTAILLYQGNISFE
ncbi:hypothetical protein B0H67DRAFT_564816, partial [Lasiosphaeris hirsuta]